MTDFNCFWCGGHPARHTVVCRECSIHDNPMSPVHEFAMDAKHARAKFAMHDFCDRCFEQIEKTLKWQDLREYTLLKSEGALAGSLKAKVARLCPTKELILAHRLMR